MKAKALTLLFLLTLAASVQAATIGPSLAARIATAPNSAPAGVVIITFNGNGPLADTALAPLALLGITKGLVLRQLGMIAVPATAGQVRALAANPAVRSIWSNDPLHYFIDQARVLAGVDRLQADAAMTQRNGGLPVTGKGDFSVVVNDSGIDATHADLKYGQTVIENVQLVTDTETLTGFTPLLAIPGVPDTDTHVGHGTHCAGIIAGTGERSGGKYRGVAPGAKLIGVGSGAGLFVLAGLGGFEWSIANQSRVGIRVISNSWGGGGAFLPDDPINIASKKAHDRNITVVFAAGNAGPGPDTLNPYAKAPWVIGVGAGTKEGGLASFSSRGTPKERRLGNSDPYDDYDAPTLVAPGTGREFDANASRFTAAIVSTRATTNVVANGLTDDAEIEPAFIPFYTQISGTSMATPFIAGVVALMLDADITLNPDQIKQRLVDTASRMPGYEEYEVGAGYVNAYAAVDKVFNRDKPYGTFVTPAFTYAVTTKWGQPEAFTIEYAPQEPGPNSSNTSRFTVSPGVDIIDVRIDFGNTDATSQGNSLGLMLYAPDGTSYSAGIALPILDAPRREVIVRNPLAGEWMAEVRGLRGLVLVDGVDTSSPVGVGVPETVNGVIQRAKLSAAPVADVTGHAAEAEITSALLNRQMDVLAGGLFHPDDAVTRRDFARHLMLNTALRQSLDGHTFGDASPQLSPIAQAVAANGSTLRDWNFAPPPLMPASGEFHGLDPVTRIDVAVALVRALGADAAAQALAGSTVTASVNGQAVPLADNDAIPPAMRGYVQVALDRGLLQAFFAMEQGPYDLQPVLTARFKPADGLTRAMLAFSLDSFRRNFVAGE
jgi:serine protease AprX